MYRALICVLILISVASHAGEILQGTPSPDFTLKDLNGNIVQLSHYRGEVVLLFFMASWVRNCGDILTHMNEFYSLYGGKGLILLDIDVMESKRRAEGFARRHAVTYPTLLDSDGKVSEKFKIVGLPITVLIGRDGRIICWDCFSLDKLLDQQFR